MIYKHTKEKGFAQIPNELLNDQRMSFKTKGILCYLLSKPDGWSPRRHDIANSSSDGLRAVSSGLKEAKELGYATLVRIKDGAKFVGSEWHIADYPKWDAAGTYVLGQSQNATVAKCDGHKTYEYSNTDPSNTEPSNTEAPLAKARFVKPTIEELRAYVQEQQMPIVEAERFMNYYEANGWRVGKNPMKCWRAAVRNWKGNWKSRRFQNQGAAPAMQKPEKSDWLMGNDELAMPEGK